MYNFNLEKRVLFLKPFVNSLNSIYRINFSVYKK